MSSKMEQIIEEIEDYIDGCKPSPISRNKILVNREQLEDSGAGSTYAVPVAKRYLINISMNRLVALFLEVGYT